jgi:hypothetical protein
MKGALKEPVANAAQQSQELRREAVHTNIQRQTPANAATRPNRLQTDGCVRMQRLQLQNHAAQHAMSERLPAYGGPNLRGSPGGIPDARTFRQAWRECRILRLLNQADLKPQGGL